MKIKICTMDKDTFWKSERLVYGVARRIIMNISEENNFSAKIVRNIGSTQAHSNKVFKILQEQEIIKQRKKIGRKIHIELTDKGKEIRYHLNQIMRMLR